MFTILSISNSIIKFASEFKLTSSQIGWLGAKLSHHEPFKSYSKNISDFVSNYWIELLWAGIFVFIVMGFIVCCISVIYQQEESVKTPEAHMNYELEKQSLANWGIICVVWFLVGSFFLYIRPLKEEPTYVLKAAEQKQPHLRFNSDVLAILKQSRLSTNNIENNNYMANTSKDNATPKIIEANPCNEVESHKKTETASKSCKSTSSDDIFDEWDEWDEPIVTSREIPCGWCNGTGECPSCRLRAFSGISIYTQYVCNMCFGSTICPKCNGLKTVTSTTIRHKDRTTLICGDYISESMGGAGIVVYSPNGKVTAYPGKDHCTSYNNSYRSSYDNICERCGGRKYESTPYEFAAASTSGARQPYHHNDGFDCPYCNLDNGHYHYPCSACQGSGRQ